MVVLKLLDERNYCFHWTTKILLLLHPDLIPASTQLQKKASDLQLFLLLTVLEHRRTVLASRPVPARPVLALLRRLLIH